MRGRIGSGACGKGRCEIARWVRETQACGCKAHAGAGVGVGATRAGGGTCRLDVRRRCPPRTSRRKSTGRCGRGPSPSPSSQGRDAQTQLRFDAQRAYLVRIRVRARGCGCKDRAASVYRNNRPQPLQDVIELGPKRLPSGVRVFSTFVRAGMRTAKAGRRGRRSAHWSSFWSHLPGAAEW